MFKLQLLAVFLILGFSSVCSVRRTDKFKNPGINTRPRSSHETRHEIQDHIRRPRGECEPPPPYEPPEDDVSKGSLWDILAKTEKQLTVHPGDGVILLGNTGHGKTTVTLFVTGSLDDLKVYELEGGDFIVVDKDQKIGISTSSRTLVPELVPDPPNSLFYIDFPGFSDNRGTNADITANYLMKKMTDALSSVRLAFVVQENSVSIGKDKTDFDNCVSSAIRMVRNLDKLQNGIGMIVTKVVNFKRQDFRTDDVVLAGITGFLKQYKEDQESKLNGFRRKNQRPLSLDDRETIELKIKFAGILLQPNKIWFLREPEMCGNFSETTWAEENKKAIINLVKDDLKSVPSTKDDFGYALSSDTLLKVVDLYAELNSYVTSNITSLVKNLRTAHFQNTLTIREFFAQAQWISNDLGNFTAVISNFQNKPKSPAHLSSLLSSSIDLRGYDQQWGLQLKTEMQRIESYMDFFDEVNREGSTFPREDTKWIVPLRDWVIELSERNEWFTFLRSLRTVLASYSFQQKSRPSSVPRDLLELQGILGENSVIVTPSIISIYNKKESIVDQDISILWAIVSEAIESPEFTCDQSTMEMRIKGTFIKSSEFTDSSGSYAGCSFPPLKATVFATRTVFFDRDIRPTKYEDSTPELAIISPVWDVVVVGSASFQIDLQGKTGLSPSRSLTSSYRNNSLAATITSIPNLVQYKCEQKGLAKNGADGGKGSPGGPGAPGGYFIGFGGQVNSGDKLEVIASGGSGGAGQQGAPGGNGEAGKFYGYDEWGTCHNVGPCSGQCNGVGTCQKGSWPSSFDRCHRKVSDVIDCYVGGCLGGHGGNGGDGGVGGEGGLEGKISLFIASGGESSGGIHSTSSLGKHGSSGGGGSGGNGGKRGDGNVAGVTGMVNCLCSWEDVKSYSSYDYSPDGTSGKTGGNSEGTKDPEKPTFTLSHSELALEYKKFALPKESEIFPNEFIKQLENSPEVANGFSPVYFARDLLNVEELHLQLKNSKEVETDSLALRLIPHYETFLGRLDNYTRSYDESGESISEKDRKFISLLYTMALNQLRSLRIVFGTPVVVNVEGYLESIESRLEDYVETGTKVIVAEERSRYRENFCEKIEQAMVFLVETVDPSINETYGEIGAVTEQLMEAVKIMIEAAEQAEKEYKEALEEMKKTAGLRSIFSIFKVGGAVLGILGGPVGGPIGSIIGSAASMTEGMALDSSGNLRPPNPLPPSIQKWADEMERRNKATSQERLDELDTLIAESMLAVKNNNETLNQLQPKIVQLEERKTALKEKGPKSSMKQFKDLEKDVKDSEADLKTSLTKRVENIEKALAGEGTPEEQELAQLFGNKTIEAVKNIENAMKIVSSLGISLYTAHKNDKKEIDRLSAMVDEAHQQVESLKKYEQAVDDLLVPFTNSIIDEMDEAAGQMANQSSVFLRVTEWKVQKTLREYNSFLQDFTQAFPDEARQYALQVENLKEAMTLMIDLYDFIQQYNEQMQFADYIANINSPRANEISLGEPENSLYDRISIAMQASLILSEWGRVIQTFQQWVYPFSQAFQTDLQTSGIPDYMKPGATTVDEIYSFLVPSISKRVRGLTASLEKYKSAAFEAVDGVLIHNEFNSEKTSTVPFHVWKVENEGRRIKELLLGKPVTISVTPEFTYQRKMSAVKFTIAEIEPKARNETLQKEFKKKLDSLRVIMTHSGVSRYLHNEEMEEMVGGNLTIQYNFERDDNKQRLGKNNVYKKLETGDLILSPYTLWTVQLRPAQEGLKFDFEEFAKYSSLVDLELIGKGSFVRAKGTRNTIRPIPLHNFHHRATPFRMF